MSPSDAVPGSPPKIKRAKQLRMYAQLFDLLGAQLGRSMSVHTAGLVGAHCAQLISGDVPVRHVVDTLQQYAGSVMTTTLRDQLARQLATRGDSLMRGPLLRQTKIAGEGWHLLEIRALTPSVKSGKSGHTCEMYVLSGQLAGQTLRPWLGSRFFGFLAYEALGYSRRRTYEYEEQQLIGLQCWGFLRESADQTELAGWAKDAGTTKHNGTIAKLRMRFDVDTASMTEQRAAQYACPNEHEHYCHECPVTVSQCPASFHRNHLHELNVAHTALHPSS